jgi:glycosyltransferase involved in cell wall biosynthesis
VRTAVILSTYNAPDRLEPTLIGYAAQQRTGFELIVADDGSSAATRDVIRAVANRYGCHIRHVWQADAGFRKCRILNQAALATDAEYLIFSDGDCVPRGDFVDVHMQHARPGRFLSGGYFKLTAQTSGQITPDAILAGRATDASWLVAHGTHRSGLGKLRWNGWRARFMNAVTPTRATWNGHNSSCWRSDLLRVNGFDERMGYWAQDREFGERLVNAGVRGTQIRYSAICVHLHHERPYKTDASRERNRQIRAETKARRATWTADGVVKASEPLATHHSRIAADIVVQQFEVSRRAA